MATHDFSTSEALADCMSGEFEPWPTDALLGLPSNEEWADLANPHLMTLRLAAFLLTKTAAEMEQMAASMMAEPGSEDGADNFAEDTMNRLEFSGDFFASMGETVAAA